MSARPLPVPDETSAAFWAASAEHVLKLPRCSRCAGFTLPPDDVCPHCHSTEPEFTFVPVSGNGRICTWTVMHQAFLPGFAVPFVLVDVQLDDQPSVRMVGRLVDGPGAALKIGDRVKVAFEDLSADVAVPAFALAETQA